MKVCVGAHSFRKRETHGARITSSATDYCFYTGQTEVLVTLAGSRRISLRTHQGFKKMHTDSLH